MRTRFKINPNTGVVYLPKYWLEGGFKGQIDVFAAGSVVVMIHPNADIENIQESLGLVSKDIEVSAVTQLSETPRGQATP